MTLEAVTVVIPFVSGVGYLRETLASAMKLRGSNWCVIVADNSRDAAAREAAQAAVVSLNDPRVTFRRFAAHVEICASFNRSMECAESDLVALLHADDRIDPEYVNVIRGLAQRRPDAAAYYCGARIIDAAGRPAFSFVDFVKRFFVPPGDGEPTILAGERGVAALSRGNFIMGPTVCFRMSRLGNERWPEQFIQAADLEFWTRILFAGGTIVGTRRIAYEYRRHAAQSTAQVNKTMYRFREEALVCDLIADRADARGWAAAAAIARRKTIVRLHLLYEAASDAARLRLRSAAAKLAFAPRLR